MLNSDLSTPRLEELIWHRMLVGDSDTDIVSQLELIQQAWPLDGEEARIFASKVLDRWLKTAVLSPGD